MKTRLLFLITLLVFLLSGYLVYMGLEPIIKKREEQLPASSIQAIIPSEDQILGEVDKPDIVPPSPYSNSNTYQVVKVVDGDTIVVKINSQDQTIRLIGIDTPETVDPRRPVGCFGKEASDKTKELLSGKSVILEKDVSETDKYNRLLRYVYLPLGENNLFVNDYLIREGYGKTLTYPPDVKYDQRFKLAMREAMEGKKGLWGKCL